MSTRGREGTRRLLAARSGLALAYLVSVGLAVFRPEGGYVNPTLDGVARVAETADLALVGLLALLLVVHEGYRRLTAGRTTAGSGHPGTVPRDSTLGTLELSVSSVVLLGLGAQVAFGTTGRLFGLFVLLVFVPTLVGLTLLHAGYAVAVARRGSSGRPPDLELPPADVGAPVLLFVTVGVASTAWAVGIHELTVVLMLLAVAVFGALLVATALDRTVDSLRDLGRDGSTAGPRFGLFLEGPFVLIVVVSFVYLIVGPRVSGDIGSIVPPGSGVGIVTGLLGLALVSVGRWVWPDR